MMAGFDPDAYLAQKSSAPLAFDPDAYLASRASDAPVLTGADAIPGNKPLAPQVAQQEPSLLDKVRGAIEVVPTLAGGMASSIVTPIAQLGHEMMGGQAFTPEGKRAAADFGRKVAGEFYQPRSPLTQQYMEPVTRFMESAVGVMPMTGLMGDIGRSARPVGNALMDAGRSEANLLKSAVAAPLEVRAAVKQAANVADSYKNATRIEAAQTANKLGIVLNPAESNPTKGNKARSVLAGNKDVNAKLAAVNDGKWTDIVKQDLGMPAEGKLNAAAVESALDVASKPYDPVRAIPVMSPSGEVLASIRALDQPATIGGKAKANAVKALVGETVDALTEGRSGAQVIDDIRQLRRDAQSVYKARDKGNNPPPADVAAADAKMGIAAALEKMIDEHAPNPQVLGDFRKARQRMAQIYDHERAIDYGTNKVDPQSYAKMLDERKGSMTGVGADIGKVAANFPKISQVGVEGSQTFQQGLTRSGVAGTIGYGLGTLVGTPIAGAVAGAVAGKFGSAAATKAMTSKAYQSKYAVPTDYRPVNNLRPVEPNYGPNQMVPYDWTQQIITSDQVPNWVPGRGEVPPARVTPTGVAPGPAQIPMSRGPVGGQTGALRAEDARLYQQQAAAEARAQAAAEAQSKTSRKAARGEVQFDLDPITGKLVPIDQTLKRATPDINVVESTGHSMTSAADKISKGQLFALTPEERISWNRTKVDIAQAIPELSGLSDKAITSKMLDRQWVADTIKTLREKDAGFNALAERNMSKLREQDQSFNRLSKQFEQEARVRAASAKRAELIEQLEALEEKLSRGRPVSLGGQGPKTRAARIITPDDANRLAP